MRGAPSLAELLRFLPRGFWTHNAVGARTREEAIEQMYDAYDRDRGRRRVPAREAFEVYRTRHDPLAGWVLYVRLRKKRGKGVGPSP